ncbi:hypothetical protein PM082_024587, partial [Marasmius tenuissimus]
PPPHSPYELRLVMLATSLHPLVITYVENMGNTTLKFLAEVLESGPVQDISLNRPRSGVRNWSNTLVLFGRNDGETESCQADECLERTRNTSLVLWSCFLETFSRHFQPLK